MLLFFIKNSTVLVTLCMQVNALFLFLFYRIAIIIGTWLYALQNTKKLKLLLIVYYLHGNKQ
ncbi:MAG: hypothetical protein RLZZ118_1238 [Bacteroidota bacterium]|jgi:hypothetical protein